jgi:hypothetical protein
MKAKVLFFTTALVLLVCAVALAAPKADLWELWLAHEPDSSARVDHSAWSRFLGRYIVIGKDGINRVAYGEVTDEDMASLEEYIARLEAVPVSRLRRAEQRALWINLYNSLTVKVVLDHYPVESIRDIDISPGFFADGPWGKELATVEGEGLSLDDIEHRILRPIWKDPRIHYAVNCAALGCPNLRAEAFTAENADRLLDEGAGEYVNHTRGAWFEGERLHVSSIYKWFMEDFGGSHEGVLDHLRRYARPELRERLEGERRFRGHDYDWTLNEAR